MLSNVSAGNLEYEVKKLDIRNYFLKMRNKTFYNYEGSLTTPPCSEVVDWHLMTEPIFISPYNLQVLSNYLGESNRNTQSLNARQIRIGGGSISSDAGSLTQGFMAALISLVSFNF